jgi:hypothetical protein
MRIMAMDRATQECGRFHVGATLSEEAIGFVEAPWHGRVCTRR